MRLLKGIIPINIHKLSTCKKSKMVMWLKYFDSNSLDNVCEMSCVKKI